MCIELPDELILDGQNFFITPLPIVENEDIISTPAQAMPATTAHVRGYVAHWEVLDQKLYLTQIEGSYQLKRNELIFADWVSGFLRPAAGSYGENFEISVENGKVTDLKR